MIRSSRRSICTDQMGREEIIGLTSKMKVSGKAVINEGAVHEIFDCRLWLVAKDGVGVAHGST